MSQIIVPRFQILNEIQIQPNGAQLKRWLFVRVDCEPGSGL